jgi:hypothetical protein
VMAWRSALGHPTPASTGGSAAELGSAARRWAGAVSGQLAGWRADG